MIIISLRKPDLSYLTDKLISTANKEHKHDQCYNINDLEQIDHLIKKINENNLQDKFIFTFPGEEEAFSVDEILNKEKRISLQTIKDMRESGLDVRK